MSKTFCYQPPREPEKIISPAARPLQISTLTRRAVSPAADSSGALGQVEVLTVLLDDGRLFERRVSYRWEEQGTEQWAEIEGPWNQ